jgi:hypothetical protein
MASNRFSNLRRAKPEAEGQPPAIAEPKEELSFDSTLNLAVLEMPRRGRPRAKRSSKDFAQATAYVKKETYTAVKHLLLDQKKEYSILVQELLDDWLQKQN